jgi:protein-S-isoprenylcysteine O-methyltransferase Ste14
MRIWPRVDRRTLWRIWLPLSGGLLVLAWIYAAAPKLHGIGCSVGLLLGLIGLTGVILSRYTLGRSFSITPKATTLVTNGVYSRIRNPIYIFGMVFLVGLILMIHRIRVAGHSHTAHPHAGRSSTP